MKGWSKTCLAECCTIISGATPSTSVAAYWDGDICWATPKDLSELKGAYISDTPRKLTRAGLDDCAASVLPAGSVLFSSRAPIGHVAINTVPMATNQGFKSFVPNPDTIDAKFLYHWLRKNRSYLESLGNGATFKEISKAIVSRIEITLPPLTEQRRIAEVLDWAEALRAKRSAALVQIDILAQGIFIDLFASTNIPEQTIGDLLARNDLLLHKDGNHGSLYPRAEDFGEDGVPFLSAKAVTDDGAIDNTLVERLQEDKAAQLRIGWISGGDVLLAHNASVGKVALYDGRFEKALIGTSLTAFRPNVDRLDSRFLEAALRSPRFQRQLEKNMGQTTRNQVPITAQRELRIPVPSISLQREFARRASAVDRLKTVHRASLEQMDAFFASLQHRGFRGEL